jgi:hypothetical protein
VARPTRSSRSPSIPSLDTGWRKLSPASRLVLAAVVLHDGPLPEAWLAELASDPTVVDPLVSGSWVQEEAQGTWRLHRSLDRTALRQRVPWSQRLAAHLALARILARTPAQLATAAQHYAAAGARDDAGRLWIAAAREHCRRHHHRLAAECFAQALSHLPAGLNDQEPN